MTDGGMGMTDGGMGMTERNKKGEEVCGKEKTGLMNQAPTGGTGDGSLFLL
ncbi:hypothetical protein ES705_14285 [subsurface metagenome]